MILKGGNHHYQTKCHSMFPFRSSSFFCLMNLCIALCLPDGCSLSSTWKTDKQFDVFRLPLVSLYLRCKCSPLKFHSQKRRKSNLGFKWRPAFVSKVTVSVSDICESIFTACCPETIPTNILVDDCFACVCIYSVWMNLNVLWLWMFFDQNEVFVCGHSPLKLGF